MLCCYSISFIRAYDFTKLEYMRVTYMLFRILTAFESLLTSWTVLMLTSLQVHTPRMVRLIMWLWLIMTIIQWMSFLWSLIRYLLRLIRLLISLKRPLLVMLGLLWGISRRLLQITELSLMEIWKRFLSITALLRRWMNEI
ncbi:TPA_asm: P overlapped [Chrysanthemum alphacytorhabdovirus 1]|nr:TPA_asm: P overlapped [Chrysanthemum alphacytorhabdovirus 1]